MRSDRLRYKIRRIGWDLERANARQILGYFLVISGFIISLTNLIGLGLVLLGLILTINPSEERISYGLRYIRENVIEIVRIISMIFMTVGITAALLGILIFKNFTIISIGLGLLLIGLIIIPESSRENLREFIRNPLGLFQEYGRERETPEVREVRKKPKGFSGVKQKEYEKIPDDAIDPYTEESIHDLITQGKSIIKCKDCGAYYGEEVWEYYGKKCVRIGCSNAEV